MKHIMKIKRTLVSISLLVFLLSSFTLQSQAEETATTIICTNSILADFTKNVLTENVSIEYIMPAGSCPEHFDTSPSDVSKIASANIIISLGWEPWLEDLIDSSGNKNVNQIKCSQLGEWNIPTRAKKYVEKIRDELSLLLPNYNDSIQTNAQKYITEIDSTSEHLLEMIENNGYIGKKVICMQWQQEFIEWLGLNVTHSYAPPERLSTQDMLNVSNAASDSEICAIIDNLQSGTEFGAHIASEAGISHIIFSNFPGAIPNTDTYLETITYNTQQLVNGIATYEYKQGDIAYLESQVSSLELQRNASLTVVFMLIIIASVLVILYNKK